MRVIGATMDIDTNVDANLDLPSSLRAGLKDAKPVALALAPIGLALGAAVSTSPLAGMSGWIAGPLLLSGAAHFAMISTLVEGSGATAALFTALVLSSRLLLYSAALAPRFRAQPSWFRWVGAHLIIDQSFVMVDENVPLDETPARFRRYWFGCTLPLVAVWVATITVGMAIGPRLPDGWRLELAGAILVTSMLRPAVAERSGRLAAVIGGAATFVLAGLPLGTGLLVGSVVAITATQRLVRPDRTGIAS